VVYDVWEVVLDERVFGVWKTVVALVSCVELVARADGVTAVWVTAIMMVSDVCVAVGDGVTTASVPDDMLESDGDVDGVVVGVVVVCVNVRVLASE
jgi:hypothetical protein